MTVKQQPYYTLPAATLAEWIERQPERWYLTSVLDFPCPGDELAPIIRKVGKNLVLRDKNPASKAHGETLASDQLDNLTDTNNTRRHKTLILSWADSDVDWLLVEDEALVA